MIATAKSSLAATTAVLAAALCLLWAAPASACAVCYGNAESSMVEGLEASVLFMVGVTYFVIFGGVVAFFFIRHHARRRDPSDSHRTHQQQGA